LHSDAQTIGALGTLGGVNRRRHDPLKQALELTHVELFELGCRPADLLRSLMTARTLLSEKHADQVPPLDALIESVLGQVDQDEYRAGAVRDARKVASILVGHGGNDAREALGMPPPNPIWQEYWRNRDVPGSAEIAEHLNCVRLEVSDKAACGPGGYGYWVSASLYLPALDENGPYDEKTHELGS
jgi:hypothetical protein